MMGVHGDRVTYTSDYFDDLYKLAVEMIKRGKAYADDTLQEKVCYRAFSYERTCLCFR
jgi:glutamyl-tRNA synthetase